MFDHLKPDPDALTRYAARYGLRPDEVIPHLRARWEAAERLAMAQVEVVDPPSRNPSPFLQALRGALGEDWTWTDDLARRMWVVEHARGLRFELSDCGGFERTAPVDEASRLATALLDAVEDGVKGLVWVLISKRTVETQEYSFRVMSDRNATRGS